MTKLGIRRFHEFMRGAFAISIEKAFKSHNIFCEADLQSIAWHEIKRFLEKHEEARGRFRVLNKPFLRDCGTYPDLVVFRRTAPWAVIELKESRILGSQRASRERDKLLQAKKALKPKRAYLVYVARTGEKRAIPGPKGAGRYYFFEVPIILKPPMSEVEFETWKKQFRAWSKYVVPEPKKKNKLKAKA